MKKILLLSALAASLFADKQASAQVHINVQFGAPTYYDPQGAYGYDDDYYYMPEYQAYYSPIRRLYFYNEGGRWMSCGRLPQRFGGIAYGRGNWDRVRGRSPWMNGGYNGGYRGGRGYENHAYGYNNGGYNNGGGYNNNGYHNGFRGNGNASANAGGYHNGNNGNGYNGNGAGGNNANTNGGYRGGNSSYNNNRGGDRGGSGGYHNNGGGNWNGRH